MDLIKFVLNKTINFLSFFCSPNIILILFIIVISYHLLMLVIRDRKYVKAFKRIKDPENISRNDLKNIPLVNIIVPAWNEGEIFRQCLISITKLEYPKLKIIVNAGGSEETINIANSFKKYENFKIIHQEGGGKIKALNECLPYVTEGILYLVDADVYFTDETLLRMLLPLVNYNENVVIGGICPLKYQEDKDLVKYLYINRNLNFRFKYSRYREDSLFISGANTCIKYQVIKTIGKFSEENMWAEDLSRGKDIYAKGFKIYRLNSFGGKLYSKFPDTKKEWISQKIRWNENNLLYLYQNKKSTLIKFMLLFIVSLFLIVFPLLIFFHFSFIIIGLAAIFSIYLKKIRRIIFFKITTDRKFYHNLGIMFFFKIILYIYIGS